METPTTGGPRPTGTAEVHTRVEVESGTSESGSMKDQAKKKVDEAKGQAQKTMDQAKGQAQHAVDEAKHRAQDAASQAKGKASQALNQAETKLEEKTGVVSKARQNPLAAMGIAFGVGFLLAGGSDDDKHRRGSSRSSQGKKKRGGMMNSMKHQISGAIMGGLSTAISQEVHSFMQKQGGGDGLGGLLDSFMGSGKTSSAGQSSSSASGATQPSTRAGGSLH